MVLLRLISGKKELGIPVEVLVLSFATVILSYEGIASTGPGWSQSPSWIPAESTLNQRRSNQGTENRARSVSPFSPSSNNISLRVGQVFLMGDLGNNYSDSIGSQLHYTYGVSELFGFNASAGYSDHSEGKLSLMTLLTGMRTNLSWFDKIVPYLNFGLGFYRPSFTEQVGLTNASYSSLLFGVHLGPGVDLEVTRQLFFGASLTFNQIFGGAKPTSLGLRELGGTFTSFFLHAGVSF